MLQARSLVTCKIFFALVDCDPNSTTIRTLSIDLADAPVCFMGRSIVPNIACAP